VTAFDVDFYRRLLECSPEGVVLVDAQSPERPVVYVNPGFESLTGLFERRSHRQEPAAAAGRRPGTGRSHRLREALAKGESCRVLLRNYRKDGTVFWNEMAVLPLRDGRAESRILRDTIAMRANGCASIPNSRGKRR